MQIETDHGLIYNEDGTLCVTIREDDIPFRGAKSIQVEDGATNFLQSASSPSEETSEVTVGSDYTLSVYDGKRKRNNDAYLQFDGIDDYAEISSNSMISESEGTISLWVKFNELNRDQIIIISGSNDADGISNKDKIFIMLRGLDNKIVSGWQTASEPDFAISNDPVTTNKWYHLTLRWSLSLNQVRLFVNGIEQNIGDVLTGDYKTNWVNIIRIGRSMPSGANNNNFNGQIAELRIQNISLTQEEIQKDMYNYLTGNESGLVVYYRMNGGYDDVLKDYAGNNDGKIYGATWKGNYGVAIGTALEFDGTDDYVALFSPSLLSQTKFAIEIEFKVNNFKTTDSISERLITARKQLGSTLWTFGIDDSLLKAAVWNGSAHTYITGETLETDIWYKSKLEYNNGTVNLYLNDNLVGTETITIDFSNIYDVINIGNLDNNGERYFDGKISNVKIYSDNQLFAEYKFDENSGTALTDYAGSNNGTINGATWTEGRFYGASSPSKPLTFQPVQNKVIFIPNNLEKWQLEEHSFQTSFVDNKQRMALNFDGTDNYVGIPNSDDINSNPTGYDKRTIEFCFKTSNDVTSRQVIYEEGGISNGINIYIYNGKVYSGAYSISEGFDGYWSSTPAIENTIYKMSLVWDKNSGTLTIYNNGSIIGSTTLSATLHQHTAAIAIGAMIDDTLFHDISVIGDGYYFKGKICEGRIWNIARSKHEIQRDMNKVLSGNEDGLVAYYKFSEGQGNILHDFAGNNDGTIYGATWDIERPDGRFYIPLEKLGFDPAEDDWVISYWKKPISTRTNDTTSFNVTSIGFYKEDWSKSYMYWGKGNNINQYRVLVTFDNNTYTSMNSSEIFDPNNYFNKWHFEVVRKTGNILEYFVDGDNKISLTLSNPLLPFTEGLMFGGTLTAYPDNALYSNLYLGLIHNETGDLIWTDEFIRKIYKNKKTFTISRFKR